MPIQEDVQGHPSVYIWNYRISNFTVWDGDSFKDCTIDFGLHRYEEKVGIRLFGIDCPEVRRSKRNKIGDHHVYAGHLVAAYIEDLKEKASIVWAKSHEQTSKYSDILGTVFFDKTNLNSHLVSKGFAKEYFGGTKVLWTKGELDHIIKELEPHYVVSI